MFIQYSKKLLVVVVLGAASAVYADGGLIFLEKNQIARAEAKQLAEKNPVASTPVQDAESSDLNKK